MTRTDATNAPRPDGPGDGRGAGGLRRLDVALSIGVGVLLVLAALIRWQIAEPLARWILSPALQVWWVGGALVVGSVLLRSERSSPAVQRVLGIVGVTWLSVVVALFAVLVAFPIGSP